MRDGAVVARRAHNPKVTGSSPVPATKKNKMKLKEQIQKDFIIAMKSGDKIGKSTLALLKSKIIESEKNNGNIELEDSDVLKVIVSSVKQRNQSIEEFSKGGRMDLVEKETAELNVLKSYLPKPLTTSEITEEVKKILKGFDNTENKNKVVGQTIGLMHKNFQGQIDPKEVSEIVNSLI
jgi:uncharacterized protein YqeY